MPEVTEAPATGAPEALSFLDFVAQRSAAPAEERPGEPTSEAPAAPPEEKREREAQTAAESETAEQAQEPEDEDDEPDQPGDAAPRKRGGFQRRIEKLQSKVRDLETQLAERSAAPRSEKSAEGEPAKPAEPASGKPKPKLEDFDSLEQFTDALTDWKLSERDAQARAAEAQAKVQAEQKKLGESWSKRADEARKQHADYDAALESASDVKVPPAMQRVLLEMEHGPELAYTLAKDKAELRRIVALPPLAAARELGKMEARLDQKSAPAPETRTTRAPKPPTVVGARASAAAPKLSDPMSFKDWVRIRERE